MELPFHCSDKHVSNLFLLQIQMAKPMVDTSPPATYAHLHLKLGKLKVCCSLGFLIKLIKYPNF